PGAAAPVRRRAARTDQPTHAPRHRCPTLAVLGRVAAAAMQVDDDRTHGEAPGARGLEVIGSVAALELELLQRAGCPRRRFARRPLWLFGGAAAVLVARIGDQQPLPVAQFFAAADAIGVADGLDRNLITPRDLAEPLPGRNDMHLWLCPRLSAHRHN